MIEAHQREDHSLPTVVVHKCKAISVKCWVCFPNPAKGTVAVLTEPEIPSDVIAVVVPTLLVWHLFSLADL